MSKFVKSILLNRIKTVDKLKNNGNTPHDIHNLTNKYYTISVVIHIHKPIYNLRIFQNNIFKQIRLS